MQKQTLEKLREKSKFLVENFEESELTKLSKLEQDLGYGVIWQNFDSNTSCLNWVIYNNSGIDREFVLVRGTPEVQPYAFLNFYTEVYKAFNIIKFITSENKYYNYPYRVGLVQDVDGNLNYAGVFYVPANKKLTLEECGFSAPNNLPNYYRVFLSFPRNTHEYFVEYNPLEIALYTMETGIPVFNAPFPIYLQKVEKYIVDNSVPFANSREFTEATWLKKSIYKYLGILK